MSLPSAPTWEKLADNVPGRDWAVIRNVWSAAAPGFEQKYASDLSSVLDPIIGSNFKDRPHVSVFEFVGGDIAAFHDMAAALHKCAYVLRSVGNCLIGGQPTWASVDAYHFSLLACRAILGLLGIHFVQIVRTRCVLDIFPQGRLPQVVNNFKKSNRGIRHPARLIFRKHDTLVEQSAMWTLLVRALNVAVLPPALRIDIEAICKIGEGFGRSRNEMLYGNEWPYKEDLYCPNIKISINDDMHSYQSIDDVFSSERDANFALAKILARIVMTLASDICAQAGVDLFGTSYGIFFSKFSGFEVAKLDALYATLYRKEGYGVDI